MDDRQRVRKIMDAMAGGNLRPLVDAMSDDVTWRWMGVTSWSRTFEGKQEVVGELFGGAAEALSDSFNNIVADGDHVVVEHTGPQRDTRWPAVREQLLLGPHLPGRPHP